MVDTIGDRRLVFSIAETAVLSGISRAFAYELVARGEIPSLRLGRRIVVPRVSIDELLVRGPTDAMTAAAAGAGEAYSSVCTVALFRSEQRSTAYRTAR